MYIKLGSYEDPEGLTYTVNFDANGGSVSPTSITRDKGDAVSDLPTPTNIPSGKEAFDGWYTDLGEKGVKVDSSYTPNTGTTLYAKYKDAPKLTVTFDTDGGSTEASQTVAYGGKATRPSTDPTKEGYIFDNWYTTSGYATVFDFANTAITTNTTIYAKFDVNVCKTFATDSWATIRDNLASDSNYYAVGCEKEVEIDMNGDSTPESYTVRLANTSTPDVCSNEGYSQTACGTVIEFVDLVEKRRMNSSSTNAGGWAATEMATYLNDDFYNKLPIDLKSAIIPTYPIVSGSGPNNDSPNITANDATKNRIYLLSAREVGFDLSGDNKRDTATDTRTLDYYEGTAPVSIDSKRIKSDSYWWLRSAVSSLVDRFIVVTYYGSTYASDATASSYWVAPVFRIGTMPEFTVSFDTDGGSATASQAITYGNKATRPAANPTKDGYYEFDDWYTSDAYNTLFDFSNTSMTEETTIYAHFIDLCRDFSTASWPTIRDNLESDPNYYAVGCEKEVEIDMDNDSATESYTVRLANTSTPEVCSVEGYSQTACGIVIDFVDIVGKRKMNTTLTNEGGWAATNMVKYLNSTFYNKLSNELQSVIILTYPIVSGGRKSSLNITEDDMDKNKIYLLSAREVGFDSNEDNKRNELTDTRKLDYYIGQFDIYNNNGNSLRVKKDLSGTAQYWWLRTATASDDYLFWRVHPDGYGTSAAAWGSIGFAPAFRIGVN